MFPVVLIVFYAFSFFGYMFRIKVLEGSEEEANGSHQEATHGDNAFPSSLRFCFIDCLVVMPITFCKFNAGMLECAIFFSLDVQCVLQLRPKDDMNTWCRLAF
jgi:hypothetical protein